MPLFINFTSKYLKKLVKIPVGGNYQIKKVADARPASLRGVNQRSNHVIVSRDVIKLEQRPDWCLL